MKTMARNFVLFWLEMALVSLFVFAMASSAKAQTVTKADILKTVEHMRVLTQEAQAQAMKAKDELGIVQRTADLLADEVGRQRQIAEQKTKEAHENAKQRDVILLIWSVFAALYAGTFFAGPLMREFPTPWNLVGAAGAYLGTAVGAYVVGRLLLGTLANLIP